MAICTLIQILDAFTATRHIDSATLVYIKVDVIFFPVAGSQRTLFSVNLYKPQIWSNNHNESWVRFSVFSKL